MINLVTTYQEKYSIFECGYHSFLGQNRTQFGVKFFIFALVYLILDLEILLTFPYAASGYENGIYGLILTLLFIVIITFGFVFELGKQALRIDSKQTSSLNTRPSGHLAQAPASLNNQIYNLGIRRFSSSSSCEAGFPPQPLSGSRRKTLLFTKSPYIQETNIFWLLVLFTIILVIYPSIITYGLNYTLSTLNYEVGASFLSVDNHDVVYTSLIPGGPSLALLHRNFGNPIDQLIRKIGENPDIVPELYERSLNLAGGVVNTLSTTVVLAGVTIPVWGVVTVVLFASSIYAFATARQLYCVVESTNKRRQELIELVTENPMLDIRNPTLDNSNLTEELRALRQELENILEVTPDDFYIIGKSKDLQKTLKTIHEYFDRATGRAGATDAESITRVGFNVRQMISEFVFYLNFSASHMINFTTIPQLNLPISWDEIIMCGSNLNELLVNVNNDYSMLLNLFS